MKRNHRQGFTLVELSIVLVIIGLLIGGLLAGQSMIRTAKIQKQVGQIQEIEIALRNFKTTYNSLPGDSDKVGVTGTATGGQPAKVCAGDNDGKIESAASVTSPTGNEAWTGNLPSDCDREITEFWRLFEHLGVTQMYKWDSFDDSVDTSFVAGTAMPKMILDSNDTKSGGVAGGVVVGWEPAVSYIKRGHKIRIGACYSTPAGPPVSTGGATASFYCGPPLKDMLALDQKMDDGRPMTGDVVATGDYYIYRIDGGLVTDSTVYGIDKVTNTYRLEPTTPGGFIGLEIHTDL